MKKLQKINWKPLKLLFWLAPMLITAGLVAGLLAGWTPIPTAMVAIGAGLALVWALLAGEASPGGFWQRRSTQMGANALISTLAVVAILGVINFLGATFNQRFDLSENQIFTLAPQSQEVVRQLPQPTKLWIFSPTPNPADRELLENFQRQGNQFSFEYVDPQAKPGIAQKFGVQAIGEAYLESGDRRQLVQTLNPQQPLEERRLTNALAQLNGAVPQKVYFLQGHGERSLEPGQGSFSQALNSLGQESYTATPLNLATAQKVPDDASVLVVASPQRPLLEPEIKAIEEYQKRQSGLMLLIDPQTNPGLTPILNNWGLTLNDRLIIDPAGQALQLGPGVTIVEQYGEHPITKDFNNGISLFPLARSIATKKLDNTEAVPLLITSDRTEAHRIDETGELEFDPATDPKGPFDLGVALSRAIEPPASPEPSPEASPEASPETSPSPNAEASPSPSPEASPETRPEASPSPDPDLPTPTDADAAPEKPQARLVVIGNASFASDGLFQQQLNGDIFLNSVNWLSQRDAEVLSIRPKEPTNRRIVMSVQQELLVGAIALALLPLVGLGTGALLWWKRR